MKIIPLYFISGRNQLFLISLSLFIWLFVSFSFDALTNRVGIVRCVTMHSIPCQSAVSTNRMVHAIYMVDTTTNTINLCGKCNLGVLFCRTSTVRNTLPLWSSLRECEIEEKKFFFSMGSYTRSLLIIRLSKMR